ncbi:Immunoglobulin lambda variable 7-46, partial [Galemys pyrenaicus]
KVLSLPRKGVKKMFGGDALAADSTRSSGNIGSSYVYWYQQRPGSAPSTVIYDDDDRPAGVPDWFSGSIDSSSNATSLTISGLQPEGEADYYCQSYDSSYNLTVLQAHRECALAPIAPGNSPQITGLQSEDEAHYYCFIWGTASGFTQRSRPPVLTQPPSLSASPGTTATLSCTLSSGTVVGGYYIYWYQQKPGSSPRYLLRYKSDSDKHQGPGVPSRFSGAKATSANAGLLLISELQPEDEAEYYCSTWHGNSNTTQCSRPRGKLLQLSDTSLPWGPFAVVVIPDICLFLVSGSSSQAVVTQEPSLTVSPGGTVTLTCGSSTGAVTNNHYPYWFQQKSGPLPKTIIYDTSNRHSWTPARFSGSLLGGKAALTLSGAQPEDQAGYYCSLVHNGIWHSDRPRRGTKTKTFLGPCDKKITSKLFDTTPGGTITLTCGPSARAVTTTNYVHCGPTEILPGIQGSNTGHQQLRTGVPARFSGFLLGNKAVLTITGPRPRMKLSITVLCDSVTISTVTNARGDVRQNPGSASPSAPE